jgi:hypothetical protein
MVAHTLAKSDPQFNSTIIFSLKLSLSLQRWLGLEILGF